MGIGLFIPLPEELASKFPSLGSEDPSPPHVTFLYVGDVPQGQKQELLDRIQEAFTQFRGPVTATLAGLDYFSHADKGRLVAIDRVEFNRDLSAFRWVLRQHLMDHGFEVQDGFPLIYRPHVTLEYMDGMGGEYQGKVPLGSWDFDEMEVWGFPGPPSRVKLHTFSEERVASRYWSPRVPSPVKIAGLHMDQEAVNVPVGSPCPPGMEPVEDECTSKEISNYVHSLLGPNRSPYGCPGTQVCLRVVAKYKAKIKDSEGNVHYEYGPRQVSNRNKEKADRVEKLRKNISDVRAKVRKDLNSGKDQTRLTALAVALMDETCERVGNEESAKGGHYGVTGWLVKHITFPKSKAVIKYVGKSGVKHSKTVETGAIIKILKDLVKGRKPEDKVLQTGDFDLTPEHVNDYLDSFGITAKDIRGYHANDMMVRKLREYREDGPELPTDPKERKKLLKDEFLDALEEAAEFVGHEPSTLRSQYLVPGLEETYLKDGTIPKTFKLATLTDAEKEEREVEDLIRPSPKVKPPREDLRDNRVRTDDPDLEGRSSEEDEDLTLNYKKIARLFLAKIQIKDPPKIPDPPAVGGPPKREEHRPGDVWQTESGWRGMNPEGQAKTVETQEEAKSFASGGEEEEAEGGEDTGTVLEKATAKETELRGKRDSIKKQYDDLEAQTTGKLKGLIQSLSGVTDPEEQGKLQEQINEEARRVEQDPEVLKALYQAADLEDDLKAANKELRQAEREKTKAEKAHQKSEKARAKAEKAKKPAPKAEPSIPKEEDKPAKGPEPEPEVKAEKPEEPPVTKPAEPTEPTEPQAKKPDEVPAEPPAEPPVKKPDEAPAKTPAEPSAEVPTPKPEPEKAPKKPSKKKGPKPEELAFPDEKPPEGAKDWKPSTVKTPRSKRFRDLTYGSEGKDSKEAQEKAKEGRKEIVKNLTEELKGLDPEDPKTKEKKAEIQDHLEDTYLASIVGGEDEPDIPGFDKPSPGVVSLVRRLDKNDKGKGREYGSTVLSHKKGLLGGGVGHSRDDLKELMEGLDDDALTDIVQHSYVGEGEHPYKSLLDAFQSKGLGDDEKHIVRSMLWDAWMDDSGVLNKAVRDSMKGPSAPGKGKKEPSAEEVARRHVEILRNDPDFQKIQEDFNAKIQKGVKPTEEDEIALQNARIEAINKAAPQNPESMARATVQSIAEGEEDVEEALGMETDPPLATGSGG